MVLYKAVNGIHVQMSDEEEAELRAEWAANDLAKQERDVAQALKKQEDAAALEALKLKLSLSDKEIDLLKTKSQ